MARLSLENLGRQVAKKRGSVGVRATANEIGISPATLSRIERGYLPDLETFRKVCEWLEVNPGDVLGSKVVTAETHRATVHFKMDKAVDTATAQALAQMIMAAQRALEMQASEE